MLPFLKTTTVLAQAGIRNAEKKNFQTAINIIYQNLQLNLGAIL